MWVYLRSSHDSWAVGFFDPAGEWITNGHKYTLESDAQDKVHYLNGGN